MIKLGVHWSLTVIFKPLFLTVKNEITARIIFSVKTNFIG